MSQAKPDADAIPEQPSPDDVIIPVMGVSGAGKSTFISLCTDQEVGVGHGLLSFTKTAAMYSLRRNGRIIRLIDTPGFDDSDPEMSDVDILNEITCWLTVAYHREPKLLLSGVIYMHPINALKLQGSARKNLTMFKLLCGFKNLKSVVLATSHWDAPNVNEHEGKTRQRELIEADDLWGDMIANGSTVMRHENTAASAYKIIDHIVDRKSLVVLDIQREMVEEGLSVDETSAGKEEQKAVLKEKSKIEKRLEANRKEKEQALADREYEDHAELTTLGTKYLRDLGERDESLSRLQLKVKELHDRKEAQLKREVEEMDARNRADEAQIAKFQDELTAMSSKNQSLLSVAEERDKTEALLMERNMDLVHQRNEDALQEHRRWEVSGDGRSVVDLENGTQVTREELLRIRLGEMEKRHDERYKRRMKQIASLGVAFGGASLGIATAGLVCGLM